MHILCEFREDSLLAENEGEIQLLKRINEADRNIFEKLSGIRHPNIAQVYGCTYVDNKLYSVQEYVQGITLTAYIEKYGVLSDELTIDFISQICSGLNELHKRNIIHRDIKPDNIIITRNKCAVLIDFGITRIYNAEAVSDTQILGTVGYAAPEQFGFSQSDKRSDIYSLGVTMNYMKTGKLPNEEKARKPFNKIIEKCTGMDADNRYKDLDELLTALDKRNLCRNGKYRFLANFPGYRSGNVLVAVIYSLYFILSLLALCAGFFGAETTADNTVLRNIKDFFSFFFLLIVPVFVCTDTFLWEERTGFAKKYDKRERRMYKVLFCIVAVLLSCVFIVTSN